MSSIIEKIFDADWVKKQAPEFQGIVKWFNSKPLKMDDLKGKVVLIDFWTYSCINCIRTLPHLREVWEKYGKTGKFIIVGVHTPEFEFEKDFENIKAALEKHGIKYPVAVDNNYETWNAWRNRYWPRHFLIDAKGIVRYDHIGEGGEEELSEQIRKLFKEIGIEVKAEEMKIPESPSPNITPELYAGSARGEIGSPGICIKGSECRYKDPKEHKRDVIYVEGEWKQEPEYLEYFGEEGNGYLVLKYRAKSFNVVMSGKKNKAEVLLDGMSFSKEISGSDIKILKGRSFFLVDKDDLYNIVKTLEVEEHELKIAPSKGLRIFAFTFG